MKSNLLSPLPVWLRFLRSQALADMYGLGTTPILSKVFFALVLSTWADLTE